MKQFNLLKIFNCKFNLCDKKIIEHFNNDITEVYELFRKDLICKAYCDYSDEVVDRLVYKFDTISCNK